jgi:hypothetical protein
MKESPTRYSGRIRTLTAVSSRRSRSDLRQSQESYKSERVLLATSSTNLAASLGTVTLVERGTTVSILR